MELDPVDDDDATADDDEAGFGDTVANLEVDELESADRDLLVITVGVESLEPLLAEYLPPTSGDVAFVFFM